MPQAMLSLTDLQLVENEPRVQDLRIAERLGFETHCPAVGRWFLLAAEPSGKSRNTGSTKRRRCLFACVLTRHARPKTA